MNLLIIILMLAALATVAVFSILAIKKCVLPRRRRRERPKVTVLERVAVVALLGVAGALPAEAGTPNTDLKVEPKHFLAGEWNLDLYGTASIANESRSTTDLHLGGGAGVSYWVTRGFGFGLRGDAEGWQHSVFDRGVGRVMVRAPLWDRVAPYGYAEGGYHFERERWLAGCGGGLELRLAKGWGLFAEAGLETTTRGEAAGRGSAGVRLTW